MRRRKPATEKPGVDGGLATVPNARAVGIIEDDRGIRDALLMILEASGYRTAAFPTAQHYVDAGASGMACLLVDHQLPGLKGFDLVARLRARGDDVPVLLMTGLVTPELGAAAAALRGCDVMHKPIDPDDILDFVARHATRAPPRGIAGKG